MLTISQLAGHAGVTVRAVRHYHAKGLLPEPERDHSGYRRYDARSVVALIRIRTLADAGVPLARVADLVEADPEEFAAAVEAIDRRLAHEVEELQRHRERIAQLAAGDSLALPPEAVAYFDRLRELGFSDRMVEVEMDSWIILAAQVPDDVPVLMGMKLAQLDDPVLLGISRDMDAVIDCGRDDPRLARVADTLAALLEAVPPETGEDEYEHLDDDLVTLLDTVFVESVPSAARLIELLEERGWRGFTRFERIDGGP